MMILLKDESYDEFVMNKNVGGKFQIKGFFFFFFIKEITMRQRDIILIFNSSSFANAPFEIRWKICID